LKFYQHNQNRCPTEVTEKVNLQLTITVTNLLQ